MIHLFDRIYIKHDNVMTRALGQAKLVISDREFNLPYLNNPNEMARAGFEGFFKNLEEATNSCSGSRDKFWYKLRCANKKIVIIGDSKTVAELLIQYWKSILKATTMDSLYELYQLYVNNENLHAFRANERQARQETPNSIEDLAVKLTQEEFAALYESTEAVDCLELTPDRLPFEMLLMTYYNGNELDRKVKLAFREKMANILRQNLAAELVAIRDDLFYETHNFYLLNPDQKETLLLDPMKELQTRPELAWVLDDVFEFGNEDAILKKYSLHHIKTFFATHQKLLRYRMEDYAIIEMLETNQFDAILEMDMADHKGNYFCLSGFVGKINGLLVSYVYQLVRLKLTDKLKLYELK